MIQMLEVRWPRSQLKWYYCVWRQCFHLFTAAPFISLFFTPHPKSAQGVSKSSLVYLFPRVSKNVPLFKLPFKLSRHNFPQRNFFVCGSTCFCGSHSLGRIGRSNLGIKRSWADSSEVEGFIVLSLRSLHLLHRYRCLVVGVYCEGINKVSKNSNRNSPTRCIPVKHEAELWYIAPNQLESGSLRQVGVLNARRI